MGNSNTMYYHKKCYNNQKHSAMYVKKSKTNNTERQETLSKGFAIIKKTAIESIINNNEILELSEVYRSFCEIYSDINSEFTIQTDISYYKKGYFLDKLRKEISGLLHVVFDRETYIYSKELNASEITAGIKSLSANKHIKRTAFSIRRKILAINKNDFFIRNTDETEYDIFDTQGIPELLYIFIRHLVNGPKNRRNKIKDVKVISICHSIINCVTNGFVKTPTSVLLGLTMKSITGSRRVLEILNRLGHCTSYAVTEEMETAIAYTQANHHTFPSGLIPNNSGLCTGIAFDNFDRFIDTTTGKSTLHDTVAIVYQNTNTSSERNSSNQIIRHALEKNTKQRKYLSSFDDHIPVYVRQTKNFPLFKAKNVEIPMNLQEAVNMNNIWALSHGFCASKAKEWSAWNSEHYLDKLPLQKIGYLPQINESPTSFSVVHKTLQIALETANQTSQQCIFVTYDLGIANKAYIIQNEMSPAFDRLFINIGAFHVELAFFKAIGKYIDSSGIPSLFVTSGLIADGCLNSLLAGKHFNRCKDIHGIAALALKVMHLRCFLNSYHQNPHAKFEMHEIWEIIEHNEDIETILVTLSDFFEEYNLYFDQTLNGLHGKTAQYVAFYIYYIDVYELYERSLRTNDLKLFIYATSCIIPIFFYFNHHNYAKWLSKNLENLLNIDESHPGLSEQLQNGSLSIRRSTKIFTRVPIDLALEQTINSNAGNKKTGVNSFKNNIYARRRWAETHSQRMSILRDFYDFVGLVKYDDIKASSNQTKKFNDRFQNFVKTVNETLNPFSEDINATKLFNLSTGKAASPSTEDFLLNIKTEGTRQMENFIKECSENPNRFNQPVKRNKINGFGSEMYKKKKALPPNLQINEIKVEKNVLGRILCIALENKIDLEALFSYPLTSVPYSLAQYDGTINSCKKGDIVSLLTKQMNTNKRNLYTSIEIVDGLSFLNNIVEAPIKYGRFAEFILNKLCHTEASEIHVIFHKYSTESATIKNFETEKDSDLYDDLVTYRITGPNQERTQRLSKCLMSLQFRNELIEFVLKHWKEDTSTVPSILSKKRVFITYGSECFLYSNKYEKKKTINNFSNNHFEIETKIVLHVARIPTCNSILIKIHNADTLLVYLVYHMIFMDEQKTIFIETGSQHRNTTKIINVRDIVKQMPRELAMSLPGWFAFTGCHYEPSFYGKGRKTTFNLLQKEKDYQINFIQLGTQLTPTNEVVKGLEKYTCALYKASKKTVNAAWVELFQKAFKTEGNGLLDPKKQGIMFKLFIFV